MDNKSMTTELELSKNKEQSAAVQKEGGLYKDLRISTRTLSWVIILGLAAMVFFMVLGVRSGGYTVTYNSKGGSDVEEQSYDFQQMITYPAPPVREGYIFTGWYRDENCTQRAEADCPVESSMELYAGWKPDE